MTREERIDRCDKHGITVDGQFEILCRDKYGVFRGGTPELHSQASYPLQQAVTIAKHMAALGYVFVVRTPGLLVKGEMTITRL